jgi:hypothetical protein
MENNVIIDIVSEKWENDAVEKVVKEKKPFELFGIIDALFVDKNKILELSDEACKQYLFMILRRLAINYPLQANHFNDGKCNAKDVVKFWSEYLYNGTSVPRWTKTSGGKKEAKTKANKSDFTKEDIKLYKKHYDITDKEFDDMMRFFPDETSEEVNEFKKYLKQKIEKE